MRGWSERRRRRRKKREKSRDLRKWPSCKASADIYLLEKHLAFFRAEHMATLSSTIQTQSSRWHIISITLQRSVPILKSQSATKWKQFFQSVITFHGFHDYFVCGKAKKENVLLLAVLKKNKEETDQTEKSLLQWLSWTSRTILGKLKWFKHLWC